MADSSELFIFGDDFDAILDILEEEEELDEYFTEAADDVSIITFLISLKSERKQLFCYYHFGMFDKIEFNCLSCFYVGYSVIFLISYLFVIGRIRWLSMRTVFQEVQKQEWVKATQNSEAQRPK